MYCTVVLANHDCSLMPGALFLGTFVRALLQHILSRIRAPPSSTFGAPNLGVDTLPDCEAIQLWFSRLCAYSTTQSWRVHWMQTQQVEALLTHRYACWPRKMCVLRPGRLCSILHCTLTADHPDDFTDAGLANLEAGSTAGGAHTMMDPLAVELCAHLFHGLGVTPAAGKASELLLQSKLQAVQGTGATVSEEAVLTVCAFVHCLTPACELLLQSKLQGTGATVSEEALLTVCASVHCLTSAV